MHLETVKLDGVFFC